MLNVALWYARHGVSVFPVSRSKGPLTAHAFKDATTERRQIRQWWKAHSSANIGARCDWFFVVDVDPRNGGHYTFSGWIKRFGELPRTWQARTGSGGLHVFFRHHASLDTIPLGALQQTGVDIKGGSRGYVLLTPSVSKSGPYRWLVTPREPLADAPAWLIDEIVRLKRPRPPAPITDPSRFRNFDRVQRAELYVKHIPGAIQGSNGSAATFRACMFIARGFALTQDEAFYVMKPWNQTCQPPWSDRDLRRKVREALERGGMQVGCLLEKEAG